MTLSIAQSITKLAKSPYEEFRGMKEKSPFQGQTHASLPQDVPSNKNAMDVDNEDGGSEGLNDVKESEQEQSFLNALSSSTTSFSNRCTNFQQLLIKMLNGMGGNIAPSTSSSEVEKLQEQLSSLRASCNGLECQVRELVKAREEACLCERKVRRGLYRVASGRLKIGEVLKVRVETFTGRRKTDNKSVILEVKLIYLFFLFTNRLWKKMDLLHLMI